jgi:hypothetical protein
MSGWIANEASRFVRRVHGPRISSYRAMMRRHHHLFDSQSDTIAISINVVGFEFLQL